MPASANQAWTGVADRMKCRVQHRLGDTVPVIGTRSAPAENLEFDGPRHAAAAEQDIQVVGPAAAAPQSRELAAP